MYTGPHGKRKEMFYFCCVTVPYCEIVKSTVVNFPFELVNEYWPDITPRSRPQGMHGDVFKHYTTNRARSSEIVGPVMEYLEADKTAFVLMSQMAPPTLSKRQLQRAHQDAHKQKLLYHIISGNDVVYPQEVGGNDQLY